MHFNTSVKDKALLVLVATLAGCTVGPDYEAPSADVPQVFVESEALSGAPELGVSVRWWEAWDDPLLNTLVQRALQHNQELGVALTRVAEARAGLRSARAAFLPAVAASGVAQRQQASENNPLGPPVIPGQPAPELENDFFDVGSLLAWELDLFGGNRRAAESARARLEATGAQAAAVQLAVVGGTVEAYWTWRGAQAARAVAARSIAIQKASLFDTKVLVETGLENELALRQAEAQLAATRIALPTWEAAERTAYYALLQLTGTRDSFSTEAGESVPTLPLASRLPATVLRYRPDVRAAERLFAAATADVGVATAAFYPRLSLTGGFGFQSDATGNLFETASQAWSMGPQLTLPLFQGGRLRANQAASKARLEAALLTYEQTVLRALTEAETSFATTRAAQEIDTLAHEAAAAATAAAELARVLYSEGLSSNLERLTAEAAEAEAALSAVQARTAAHLAMSRLYRALGGGSPAWTMAGDDMLLTSSP